MWETQVWSQAWQDPLEKELTTHSSIPAWEIRWTGEPGRLESMGSQRARHSWATNTHTPAPLKFTMVCEEAEESCKVTWSLGSRRASGWGQGEGTGPSSLEWSLVYRMLANSHAPGWTRWIMTHTVNTVQSLRGEKSDMNDHFQHTWLCLQVWIIEKIFQRLL